MKSKFKSYRFLIALLWIFHMNEQSSFAKNSFFNRTNKLFSIANVLQSNMVIQQNQSLHLWGNAETGSRITIMADWLHKPIVVYADAQKNWSAMIKVPRVVKGDYSSHEISVINKQDTLKLNNVLIGELWLCSGQSNMELTMKPAPPWHKGVTDYEKEIAAANFPHIRLFKIPRDTSSILQEDVQGTWKECTPSNIADFSGVAYYFARELAEQLDLPVGLVLAAYGGASCQAFTSRAALTANPELRIKYLDPFDANPQGKDVVARPTLIYNKMIFPLLKLSIKGILWYQGESNSKDKQYLQLCTAMLNDWRKGFSRNNLPFYFVQMPSYDWKIADPYEDFYAYFRESQEAMLTIKNTGMVVTVDLGESDNIHPSRKKEVGIRLAKVALRQTYHLKNQAFQGPAFSKLKTDRGKLTIIYTKKSIIKGITTSDHQSPRCFYIAGADERFALATAQIIGNKIVLYSNKVANPIMVRYAFLNVNDTNLVNSEGLPAIPFRTDDVDHVSYIKN